MRRTLVVAVLAVGTILSGAMVTSAQAADQPVFLPAKDNPLVPVNSVNSNSVRDGSLNQRDLAVPLYNLLRTPAQNKVTGWSVLDGSLQYNDLSADAKTKLKGAKGDTGEQGVKGDPGNPATDKFGEASASNDFSATTITDVGGTFGKFTATVRATKLGQFVLTPGTYLLNSQFRADRTVAGAPGTRPQLALRVDDGTDWGKDFGTVMGTDLSPSKDRELYGSGFKVVTVTEDTTVQVFGFGYNDDSSAAGSGEFTMSASVVAILVG